MLWMPAGFDLRICGDWFNSLWRRCGFFLALLGAAFTGVSGQEGLFDLNSVSSGGV